MTPQRAAIITGASRGIGRAIALGLAADGWAVTVAAKSVESSDKLPGSIHTVAAEVEAAGGKALAVQTDLRDEAQIDALIARTVDHFQRIDLLVNNAGAMYWKPVSETPAKRFDLVMGVNARAALLACRAALPALVAAKGHVINMSPPMDLSIVPGRVAYAISKLGMTLLTFGLAAEVKAQGVSVNSLWPVTIIESQASINHGLGTPAMWRKPDILVDCVRRIAAKPPGELTGQALLDEDFLLGEGVTDFAHYACVPGAVPPRLASLLAGR